LIGVLVVSQLLLLFLAADTSRKRLKPRAHILVACTAAAVMAAILFFAAVLDIGLAIQGEKFIPDDSGWIIAAALAGLWLGWAVVFYLFMCGSSEYVNRMLSWVLKGSVLELLIAVPAHVIVRRRGDCCAPYFTGWGIAAGIAVMLLSFGPSVFFLLKKRMSRPRARAAGAS